MAAVHRPPLDSVPDRGSAARRFQLGRIFDMPAAESHAVTGAPTVAAAPILPPFDRDDLETTSRVARIAGYVLSDPKFLWIYGLLRDFWPVPTWRGWAMVTRYDDVQEVLQQDKVFEVPFGPNVELLNDGPNFLLGMPDSSEYRQVYRHIVAAF